MARAGADPCMCTRRRQYHAPHGSRHCHWHVAAGAAAWILEPTPHPPGPRTQSVSVTSDDTRLPRAVHLKLRAAAVPAAAATMPAPSNSPETATAGASSVFSGTRHVTHMRWMLAADSFFFARWRCFLTDLLRLRFNLRRRGGKLESQKFSRHGLLGYYYRTKTR